MKRRPLTSRDSSWAKLIAKKIAQTGITPNQISLLSIVFALMSGVSFYFTTYSNTYATLFLILGVVGLQMRLLCNLFDGMVAIEYDKKTSSGGLFNEIPDRISDTIIILGFCLSVHYDQETIYLGLACIIISISTAYIRALGASMGAGEQFQGPMAKQHRMALITGTVILILILNLFPAIDFPITKTSLWIMLCGGILTCYRRIYAIYMNVKRQASKNQLAN
jgi:phosphatidylglycerophosphate synthase